MNLTFVIDLTCKALATSEVAAGWCIVGWGRGDGAVHALKIQL